jgi:hypothetical protein
LPPLLNNRHVTAVWKFTDDFTGLNASRFDRQPERLSHDSFNRLTPVGHTLGKIAGFLRHGAPQKAKPPPQQSAGQLIFVEAVEFSQISTAREGIRGWKVHERRQRGPSIGVKCNRRRSISSRRLFGILLHAFACKAIAPAKPNIQFHLLPNAVVKSQKMLVFRLGTRHRPFQGREYAASRIERQRNMSGRLSLL